MNTRLNRRRLLETVVGASVMAAGCSGSSEVPSDDRSPGASESDAAPSTSSPSPNDTPPERSETIFVAPDGSDRNPGTQDSPLGSIQAAIDEAQPGETISLTEGIHTSGDPDRPVGITRRPGEPDDPITITGPKEAVVRGPPTEMSTKPLFHVTHSHVHLRGMTLDGLTRPDRAGEHRWYREQLVDCNPPTWQDTYPDYLTDVEIKPHAVGNARTKLVNVWRTNDVEIGEFSVVGPAGVEYSLGPKDGYVLGAVVSLGRSSNNFGTSHYPWEGPDESHDVHVHHIAHLDGHEHTELVKLHAGNYDVTIEYCTDLGGNSRDGIQLPGARSTVRWCDIQNGDRNGVSISVPRMRENGAYEQFSTIPDERFPGVDNSIYGNRLLDNEGGAISFHAPDWVDGGLESQRVICGNEIDGEAEGAPGEPCPSSVPDGDGIGHLGGDSPWA